MTEKMFRCRRFHSQRKKSNKIENWKRKKLSNPIQSNPFHCQMEAILRVKINASFGKQTITVEWYAFISVVVVQINENELTFAETTDRKPKIPRINASYYQFAYQLKAKM